MQRLFSCYYFTMILHLSLAPFFIMTVTTVFPFFNPVTTPFLLTLTIFLFLIRNRRILSSGVLLRSWMRTFFPFLTVSFFLLRRTLGFRNTGGVFGVPAEPGVFVFVGTGAED